MAEKDTEVQQEATEAEDTEGANESEEIAEKNQAEAKIAELEEQLAAGKDRLLRTAAEYANYRSRTEREN